jgi:hypothetical protein
MRLPHKTDSFGYSPNPENSTSVSLEQPDYNNRKTDCPTPDMRFSRPIHPDFVATQGHHVIKKQPAAGSNNGADYDLCEVLERSSILRLFIGV